MNGAVTMRDGPALGEVAQQPYANITLVVAIEEFRTW